MDNAHAGANAFASLTMSELTEFVLQLPAAVAILDPDMRFVAASARFMADFDVRDIAGRSDPTLFPQDLERFTQAFRRGLAGHTERCEEAMFRRADGTEQWRRWEVSPWVDATGRTLGVLLATEPVTELKHAREAAASASAARARELDIWDRLRQLAKLSAGETDLAAILLETVDIAMAVTGAQFSHIELVDAPSGTLQLLAHRGFSVEWVQLWNAANRRGSLFASVLAQGTPVVINDVAQHADLNDSIARPLLLQAGVHTVQLTPIVTLSGEAIGILYTHFKTTPQTNGEVLGRLARITRYAADCIDHVRIGATLALSEARLRALVTASSYAIYTMSADWTELRQLHGQGFLADTNQPSRTWLESYIDPEDRDAVLQAIRSAIESRTMFQLQHRVRRADGSVGWTWSRAVPLLDATGKITEWFGAASDITEYREHLQTEFVLREVNAELERAVAERTAALQRSEIRLKAILDSTSDAVVTVDTAYRIVTFNQSAQQMFGYAPEEILGRHVADLAAPRDPAQYRRVLATFMQSPHPHVLGRWRALVARHRDGRRFPVDLRLSPITDLGLVVACIRDLSATRALEHEVLNRAVFEQQRIGQELHDGTQQELTGLGLLASTLADKLARDGLTERATLAEHIAASIARAGVNVQRIARGLVPFRLEATDLPAALHDLASSTLRDYGIVCGFQGESFPAIQDAETATHLHRIAQEAVTNAVRHGKAQRIDIRLVSSPERLVLEIEDDGVGIRAHVRTSKSHGAGLRLMEHRASILGGTLEVNERGGGGTLIRCAIETPPSP